MHKKEKSLIELFFSKRQEITEKYWQFEWSVYNNGTSEEQFNYSVENGILIFVNQIHDNRNDQYSTVPEFYNIENGHKLNLKMPEDLAFFKSRVKDSLFLLRGSIINLYTGKILVEIKPLGRIYSADGLIKNNNVLVREFNRLYTYDIRNRKIIWEKMNEKQISYLDESPLVSVKK